MHTYIISTSNKLDSTGFDTAPFRLSTCTLTFSPDACYLSRHVALKVGARVETPALTVNRLCGSGFETVVQVNMGKTHTDLIHCFARHTAL